MADKLLIIDDSPKNIQVVANFLENEGYDLSFATDGKEALQIMSKENFDLILLDVVMPEIDGFEVCARISSDPLYKNIPILFLTVKTDPESIIKGFESGGVDYITKPFNPYELLARIKTHLRLKSIQNQFRENNARLIEEMSLRHKAERQLKNLNAELEYKIQERTRNIYKLAGIIDQLYEDVIITDKTGIIEYVNPSFEKNSGFSADEVIGDMPRFMEKGQYSGAFYDDLWATIRSGKTWQGIFTNRKKDGTLFEEEVTVVPIINHGKDPEGYFSLKRDVSAQKQLEKQLMNSQKMEAVGTLAGGIAHDFNNILTAILGYSEIAKFELLEKGVRCSKIEEVIKASKRAKELVRQILLLSRRADTELMPVRIDLIVNEALKLIRSSVPSYISIKYHVDETKGTVLADPTQIHQVIMNLCTNAYQAIGDSKGTMNIELKKEDLSEEKAASQGLREGSYLTLRVEDDGQGIDPSDIEKIFEPYFTTKRAGEGTGLGLSIVNGIITGLKGRVKAKSGGGLTSFSVYMPYHGETEQDELQADDDEAVKGTGTILLVDDEEKITEVGSIMLQSMGYAVTKTECVKEALEILEKNNCGFDLVITDLTMPEMSGIDFADRISEINSSIPVILCSGFKRENNDRIAKSENIKEFIAKPFTKRELGDTVKKVMDSIKA